MMSKYSKRWMLSKNVKYLENGPHDSQSVPEVTQTATAHSFWYGDRDAMAYRVNDNWVTDGDHHRHLMHVLDISGVGFSACSSWLNCEKRPRRRNSSSRNGSEPLHGGDHNSRETVKRGWPCRIRILTDSRSVLDSLQTPLRHPYI